jgi:hypothetical protein
MRKMGKMINFPKKIDFPNKIVLNKLERLPEIIEIPIHFGMDSATVRIIDFSIKCDFFARVSILFDFETYKYESIEIYFEGIENLSLEESDELYYQKLEEEILIVFQAETILMDHKELSKYQEALRNHLLCALDQDIDI